MKISNVIVPLVFAFTVSAGAQERSTIDIPLQLSVGKATEIVQATIAQQGFMMEGNQGGVIAIAPYKLLKAKHIRVALRVNIIGNDKGQHGDTRWNVG